MSSIPALSRPKKCGREGCVCNDYPLPITEILYGKEHPSKIHSVPSKQFPHSFRLVDAVRTSQLKKLSRKYPKVYKFVKERKLAGTGDSLPPAVART